MRLRLFFLLLILPLIATGCATLPIPTTIPPVSEATYTAWHPYYFEFCALSEPLKKPGNGAELRGGIGGHSTIYLNGACLKGPGYPELETCREDPANNGVGISVNAHFVNANWVAISGHDFFYHGDLKPGQKLTRDVYDATKAQAKRLGVYDAIEFYDEVFDDMPRGYTRDAFKYEVSIATDYALGYGRDRYCARVPVSAGEMALIVDYLNGLNRQYRDGKAKFEWSVFNDNCIHVAHNALAAIGFWPVWPTHRPLPIAVFDFPVPKNEFINIMRRANDMPIDDLMAVWRDRPARQALLAGGTFPTRPGALATFEPVVQDNTLYDTKLDLIFYDDPVFGSYEDRYRQMVAEPRYTDLPADLDVFRTLYARAEAKRHPLAWWLQQHPALRANSEFPLFYDRYGSAIETAALAVRPPSVLLATTGG